MAQVLEIPTVFPTLVAPSQSKTGTQVTPALTTSSNEAEEFGASTDFHFPVSFFDGTDSENILEDILDELDIFPDSSKGTMTSMEPGLPTSGVLPFVSASSESQVQCRPVSPSSVTSSCSQSPSQSPRKIIVSPDSFKAVAPVPSLEKATAFSVPNPILEAEKIAKEERKNSLKTEKKGNKNSSNKKEGASAGMKRKLSGMSSDDDKELTEEELLERRERNRSHAKKSRQRKKSLTQTLEQSVKVLKEENQKLREEIYQIIGQKKVEDILNKQKQRAREDFMTGLMDPKNRVVNGSAMSFFRSLRRSVPKRDDE
jgi:hypothetical protein